MARIALQNLTIAQNINDLVGNVLDGVKGRVRGENSREERRLR
jgi:hypothetical protein